MKSKFLATIATVALTISAFAPEARSEEVMRISSWLPPSHVNTEIFPTWIEWIEEATDGRVTGKIEYDLASPPDQIDIVTDGAADASWIFHGYNPGRFVTTKLIELPGLLADAEASSVAHQRAYETYLKDAGEHEGVVVAAMMTHGPGQLYMRTARDGLAALDGAKIRIGGGVSADVAEALGMVGVQVPAPQVYETLSGGVADGVMMPIDTNKALRLYEVAPETYIMPGGFYRGSFALILSEAFLARLSDEDREAVLSTTGERLAAMAGAAWAKADIAGLELVEEVTSMHTFSDEDQQTFAGISAGIRQETIDAVADRGVDAAAALEMIEETARAYVQ
ncbi:MAG: TRAP transporter substrate-binding protein [Silicimonas sp.]|jgi:TRAP-type C4-dicarboxylate transport system substrate-binding protein|uniref:TRAP transporter substrate-binding protein n=1 Tax=Roseitalea porphyridii TaxID=1852022 RepID=UPI0032EB13AF